MDGDWVRLTLKSINQWGFGLLRRQGAHLHSTSYEWPTGAQGL
jgi:hypothetical protein